MVSTDNGAEDYALRFVSIRAAVRSMRTVRHFYPLTIAGTAVFAAGVLLVARGTALDDLYRLALGSIAVSASLLIALVSRFQAGRFTDIRALWEPHESFKATMLTPEEEYTVDVSVAGIRPWWFFRVHARLAGRYRVGENTTFRVFEEVARSEPGTVRLRLNTPLPGVIHAVGTIEIRDIFGLSRARFDTPSRRVFVVPPALPTAPQLTRMAAASGDEETAKTRSPEEERYYMREYLPGDRFRDINWKASQRIRSLFTRVSPETEEESRTISIYLRHFGSAADECIEALAHVSYIKGWLVEFMKTLRSEDAGVTFRVVTGNGIVACRDDDEIDRLWWDLADLSFVPEPASVEQDPSARLVVIFTTPFDTSLASCVARERDASVHIFSTQFADVSGNAAVHSEDRVSVLFDGRLLPTRPARREYRGSKTAQNAPDGAQFLEEVGLSFVHSYPRGNSPGPYERKQP